MTSLPTTARRSNRLRQKREPIPVPARAPGAFSRIGELALLNQLATEEQLQDVLSLQRKAHELGAEIPLGELLVLNGVIDTRTRDALLHLQRRQRELGYAPRSADTHRLSPRRAQELGRILLRNGLAESGRIEEALRIQSAVRACGFDARLGEILVRHGVLTDADVEHALQIQRCATHSEREETLRLRRAVAHEHLRNVDLLFGRVAVHHGFISEELLAGAVEVQEMARDMGFHLRIGEILHDQEVLTAAQIEQIAAIQDIKKESFFEISPHRIWYRKVGDDSLGDLLVRHRLLDPWQVQECVRIQSGLGRLGIVRPLGEIVLMKEYVSADQLHEAIEEQQALRARDGRARGLGKRARRIAAAAAVGFLGIWAVGSRVPDSPPHGSGATQAAHAGNRSAGTSSMVAGAARGASLPAPEDSPAPTPPRDREREELAARAAALFEDLAPREPALRLLAWGGAAGPRFETIGRAHVPDETEMRLSLLYFGTPVEIGAAMTHARNGLFRSLLRPPNCECAAPPGLYTAVAEWRVGQGDEQAQVRLACSICLGTEEEADEFRTRAAVVRANWLDELERWEQELRTVAQAGTESRTLQAWLTDLAGWRRAIDSFARAADVWCGAQLVSPCPDFDRRVPASVAQARLSVLTLNAAVCETFGRSTGVSGDQDGAGSAMVRFPLETLGALRSLLRDARRALAAANGGTSIARVAQADLERRIRTAQRLRRELNEAVPAAGTALRGLAEVELPPSWIERWEAEAASAARPDSGILEILGDRPPSASFQRLGAALTMLRRVEQGRIASIAMGAPAVSPDPAASEPERLEEEMQRTFAKLEGER